MRSSFRKNPKHKPVAEPWPVRKGGPYHVPPSEPAKQDIQITWQEVSEVGEIKRSLGISMAKAEELFRERKREKMKQAKSA